MIDVNKYTLSNDFLVDFQTNELSKINANNQELPVKVEPRIMQVLQLLIKHSPNVVSREQLIREVWDNYGGADDALNQAVSHLRKILSDTNKEKRMIQTVVKKGYRLTASFQMINDKDNHQELINEQFKIIKSLESKLDDQHKLIRWLKISLAIVFISFLALLISSLMQEETPAPSVPQNQKENSLEEEIPNYAPRPDEIGMTQLKQFYSMA